MIFHSVHVKEVGGGGIFAPANSSVIFMGSKSLPPYIVRRKTEQKGKNPVNAPASMHWEKREKKTFFGNNFNNSGSRAKIV